MATVDDQSVQTGNTIYLMVQQKPIGRAQSFNAERSFGTTGVYEIGSIMPQEHVFLKYTGSIQMERFRMKKQSLATLGFAALGEEVLKLPIIDIVAVDNLLNEVIIAYRGCSIDTYNEDYRANEIVTESARFYYLTSTAIQSASGVAQGNNTNVAGVGHYR